MDIFQNDFNPPKSAVTRVVNEALREDFEPLGDITSLLIPQDLFGTFRVVARASGILAGTLCLIETLHAVDEGIVLDLLLGDGSELHPGSEIAQIRGRTRSVLGAERTFLNLLSHLSGIATLTSRFVKKAKEANGSVKILDTRKTTPGLRALEKAAVRAGGGTNHRGNLSEAVLIKDNHMIDLSLSEAISYAKQHYPGRMVEVECDSIEQVQSAVNLLPSVILLDNMTVEEIKQSIETVSRTLLQIGLPKESVLLEVSGGVSLENVYEFAATGVNLISVGSLTHSAQVLDIALDAVETK